MYRENLLPSFACSHTMREWGSLYARLVLDRCGYNKRKVCRELRISYDIGRGGGEGKVGQLLGKLDRIGRVVQEPKGTRWSRKGPYLGGTFKMLRRSA